MVKLQRSIGYIAGTSYCVTVIVGAGILGLPGVAAELAGPNAVYAWALDFLLAIPLLIVFGKLIALTQSAGGIADFIKVAFGKNRLYRFAQVILLLTLCVGTAAISLVGANYLASSLSLSSLETAFFAILLIGIPTIVNSYGVKFGGRVQSVLAASLILFLTLVILSSVLHWNLKDILSSNTHQLPGMWKAMGLIWFAFTGIEMISFLGEEFISPRVFILSVVTAFLVVGFLYLGLAIALKQTVPLDSPLLSKSPLVAILNANLGTFFGNFGGMFGFLLILINQCAAILGASRLIFSVGRDGNLLPAGLGELNERGVPWNALLALGVSSCLVVILFTGLHLSLEPLFETVSQNWFLLYVLAIGSFLKLAKTRLQVLFGISSLLLSMVFMSSFSWYLILPSFIFVLVCITKPKEEEKYVG